MRLLNDVVSLEYKDTNGSSSSVNKQIRKASSQAGENGFVLLNLESMDKLDRSYEDSYNTYKENVLLIELM